MYIFKIDIGYSFYIALLKKITKLVLLILIISMNKILKYILCLISFTRESDCVGVLLFHHDGHLFSSPEDGVVTC